MITIPEGATPSNLDVRDQNRRKDPQITWRFSQIVVALKQAEAGVGTGKKLDDLIRKYGI